MKKKTLGLLAAILSVCMLAGCGAKAVSYTHLTLPTSDLV